MLAAIVAAAVAHAYLIYAPCDDTYIYLAYARSALDGDGLTFNGLRVQGFTSPLWLALVVAIGGLGVPLTQAANVLSVASGSIALAATYALGRVFGLSRGRSLAAPILLALTTDFAFYMGNGLESVAFVACCALLAAPLARPDEYSTRLRGWALPTLSIVTVLLRPEGLLPVVAALGYMGWRSRDLGGLGRATAIIALCVAPVQVALRLYYGDWLPNTYYVKAGAGWSNLGSGLEYVLAFVLAHPVAVLAFLGALLVGWRSLEPASLMALGVVAWLGLVAKQGGDNLVGYRMLLPALPPMFVYTVVVFRRQPTRLMLVTAVLAGALYVGMWNGGYTRQPSWDSSTAELAQSWSTQHRARTAIGRELRERLSGDALIAVNAAGAIPFYSGLPAIDMLGLNDRHIAHSGGRDRSLPYGHQAGDGDYVLSRSPAVILFGGAGSETAELFLGDRQIATDPRFAADYAVRRFENGNYAQVRRDVRWVSEDASPRDGWWSALSAHCGEAFAGSLASDDPGDRELAGQRMVMHIRTCEESRLEIPFQVGDDRSRVWVLTRTEAGIELKHHHRHEDGSADRLTLYGGETISEGSEIRQEFPADSYSRELFVANEIPQSAANVWSMEIVAGERFSYILRRPDRYFRADFDLAAPVETPLPPWGDDGSESGS